MNTFFRFGPMVLLFLLTTYLAQAQEPCCGVFTELEFVNGITFNDYPTRSDEICPQVPVDGTPCSTDFTPEAMILDNVDNPSDYCFIVTVSAPGCPEYPKVFRFDNMQLDCSTFSLFIPRNTLVTCFFEYYERCGDCNQNLPLNVRSREYFTSTFSYFAEPNVVAAAPLSPISMVYTNSIRRTIERCGQ